MQTAAFGLYVHIPFCAAICHYCDFAKTANFSEKHIQDYMDILEKQLLVWKSFLVPSQKFSSVFFGGGTPSLLTHEYAKIMSIISEMINPDAEVTLEANPDHVRAESVKAWRELGFNRITIGIQSFDPLGLKDLTRLHDVKAAINALDLAVQTFPKTNGDLIYGWQGQSLKSWENDLSLLASTGVNHISLYALTYEGHTPFVRAEVRGMREQMSDEQLAAHYELACEKLSDLGFRHEEISNWAKDLGSCDHNWIYWRGDNYVSIGAGAHGFVDDGSDIGLRYSLPRDFRVSLRRGIDSRDYNDVKDLIRGIGGQIDDLRDVESWKLEYVGCGLRSAEGIDLNQLKARGLAFVPNAKIQRALLEGKVSHRKQHLILDQKEWFRETGWAFEVCDSLKLPDLIVQKK
jgi:oxygen-independent coproporphyrinogen III oxidase